VKAGREMYREEEELGKIESFTSKEKSVSRSRRHQITSLVSYRYENISKAG
jgi:hypothetical protein